MKRKIGSIITLIYNFYVLTYFLLQKIHIELVGPSEHLRVRQIRVLNEVVKSARIVDYISKSTVDQNRNQMQLLDLVKSFVYQVGKI